MSDEQWDLLTDVDMFPERFDPIREILSDLSLADRNAMRRHYRTLRIRVPYAEPGDEHRLDGHRHSGFFYGLSREAAKTAIVTFYRDLAWCSYLGSK